MREAVNGCIGRLNIAENYTSGERTIQTGSKIYLWLCTRMKQKSDIEGDYCEKV